MRTAEVKVNKQIAIRVNDREHHAFKVKCVQEGKEMAEVIREFMRDYVSKKKK